MVLRTYLVVVDRVDADKRFENVDKDAQKIEYWWVFGSLERY